MLYQLRLTLVSFMAPVSIANDTFTIMLLVFNFIASYRILLKRASIGFYKNCRWICLAGPWKDINILWFIISGLQMTKSTALLYFIYGACTEMHIDFWKHPHQGRQLEHSSENEENDGELTWSKVTMGCRVHTRVSQTPKVSITTRYLPLL